MNFWAQNMPKNLTKKMVSFKKLGLQVVEQTSFDKKFPQFTMSSQDWHLLLVLKAELSSYDSLRQYFQKARNIKV